MRRLVGTAQALEQFLTLTDEEVLTRVLAGQTARPRRRSGCTSPDAIGLWRECWQRSTRVSDPPPASWREAGVPEPIRREYKDARHAEAPGPG